jgi:hypothetical protein
MLLKNKGVGKSEGRRSGSDRRVSASLHYRGFEKRTVKERRIGIERRKHQRYQVKDIAFAKLWSMNENDYVKDMGQLLDISPDGLALHCSVDTEKIEGHCGLGIFVSGSDFSIEKIPFKIVSNVEMTDKPTLNLRAGRRYGIQFKELTADQKSKLDYFLQNHTFGQA